MIIFIILYAVGNLTINNNVLLYVIEYILLLFLILYCMYHDIKKWV